MEVRREPTVRASSSSSRSELVFIWMGDQAHTNRPRGDSTGGMLTLVAGLANLEKAIGSNDAEVQSILEAEDQIFRVQLLWTELHGASGHRPLRQDLVETTEQQVLLSRASSALIGKGLRRS